MAEIFIYALVTEEVIRKHVKMKISWNQREMPNSKTNFSSPLLIGNSARWSERAWGRVRAWILLLCLGSMLRGPHSPGAPCCVKHMASPALSFQLHKTGHLSLWLPSPQNWSEVRWPQGGMCRNYNTKETFVMENMIMVKCRLLGGRSDSYPPFCHSGNSFNNKKFNWLSVFPVAYLYPMIEISLKAGHFLCVLFIEVSRLPTIPST